MYDPPRIAEILWEPDFVKRVEVIALACDVGQAGTDAEGYWETIRKRALAAGAIEAMMCARAIHEGVIPPTINYRTPDPECDLDYVPLVAREQRVDTVLTVGSGFGGFQSAMVLRRPGARRAGA